LRKPIAKQGGFAIGLRTMLIGYARVSNQDQDQDTEAQITVLENAGCELIFKEKASGARWERPELHRLLGHSSAKEMSWSFGNSTGCHDHSKIF